MTRSDALVRVVWLCGTSGVGKSTVAWALYRRGAAEGRRIAYVDIDQLGMCFPPPQGDEDRDHIKALNLGAVVANFVAAGAQHIVVSGVMEPVDATMYADALTGVTLTWCQLHVDPPTLQERLEQRGWSPEDVDLILEHAETLRSSDFAHISIETAGLTVQEVEEQVVRALEAAEVGTGCGQGSNVAKGSDAPFETILITGPPSVGKSTVSWKVFERAWEADIRSAYLDLRQVSFLEPPRTDDPTNDTIKVQNVAALWRNFSHVGARRLVLNGQIEKLADIASALPHGRVTTYILTASPNELRRRTEARRHGGGRRLAGEVEGQGRPIAETGSARHAGVPAIDTTGLTPDEVAICILENTPGWLD